MIPVIFVLGVTALKDFFEDRRRLASDRRVNNSTCRVYVRWVDKQVLRRCGYHDMKYAIAYRFKYDFLFPRLIFAKKTVNNSTFFTTIVKKSWYNVTRLEFNKSDISGLRDQAR